MGTRSALQRLAIGIALLVCPGSSAAVVIEFDVSGASTERNRLLYGTDSFEFHETNFSAGSSLTLETDANGDGVSGDYTVAASHFVIEGSHRNPISDLGAGETGLTWEIVGVLSGGTGHLEDYFEIWMLSFMGLEPIESVSLGSWRCRSLRGRSSDTMRRHEVA
jgi:hypothetical protein